MTKLVVPFLLFLFFSCARPSSRMNFIKNNEQSFEQILTNAQKAHKIVFVDIYTTWCGPCKWMDENTFRDAKVTAEFNKKFINYKVDGESFEGVNIALNYKVDSFPTYLFLDENGKVIKRIEGTMPPESFLEETRGIESWKK